MYPDMSLSMARHDPSMYPDMSMDMCHTCLGRIGYICLYRIGYICLYRIKVTPHAAQLPYGSIFFKLN